MLLLPVELQRQCFTYLENDINSLRNLRLTNKQLQHLATEFLFRTVVFLRVKRLPENCDEEYAAELEEDADIDLETAVQETFEKYTNIQQSHDLAPLVSRLVFNTCVNPDETYEMGGQDSSDFVESFEEALISVSSFPNLTEISLKFAKECAYEDAESTWEKEIPENMAFRNMVLESFFQGLQKAEDVRCLTIKNLQDYTEAKNFETEGFKKVRARLEKLHLQITTEDYSASEECPVEAPGAHQGFGSDLLEVWLKPLCGQLTHLSIYSTQLPWGVWPFVDLRKVPTFPCLKSLSLGNWTIAHEWQVDWILGHGSMLEELRLDACPIVFALRLEEKQAEKNFPDLDPIPEPKDVYGSHFKYVGLRWHDVFPRLRTGLSRLKHFAIGKGNWYGERAFEERYELLNKLLKSRYVIFDSGVFSRWTTEDAHIETYGQSPYKFHSHPDVERHYSEVEFPQCMEEDMTALGELMQVVDSRAATKV